MRKGHKQVTTKLLGARRLGVSAYGNPTWELQTDAGTYRTQANASCGYEIENYMRRGRIMVTLTMTASGRVYGIENAKEL